MNKPNPFRHEHPPGSARELLAANIGRDPFEGVHALHEAGNRKARAEGVAYQLEAETKIVLARVMNELASVHADEKLSEAKLERRNPERAKKLEARNYGPKAAWIRTLRCYVTARDAPSVAAHVKSRGAGGDSTDIVPLNALVELDWHMMPEAVFKTKYGVSKQDCKDAAERYEARFQAIQTGTVDVEF